MSGFSAAELLEYPEIFRSTMFKTGIWRARVINVLDPENRGRVQVRIVQLHSTPSGSTLGAVSSAAQGKVETVRASTGSAEVSITQNELGVPNPPGSFDGVPDTSLPWAEPCFPWGGQKRSAENAAPNGNVHEGFYMIPEVGSWVFVAFENGFVQHPIWIGCWYGADELPTEIDTANPEKVRLIKTRIGHMLLFNDAAGSERVFLATADDDGVNTDGPRIRYLELNDTNTQLILRNAPVGDDEQVLIMDRTTQKITLKQGVDQLVEQDGSVPSTTMKNSPTQSIIQDEAAGTTTIIDGATSAIFNSTAGTVTITNGGTTITIAANGDTSIQGVAASSVNLGSSPLQGVCVESLITAVRAMVDIFDAHQHTITGGSSAGTTTIPLTTQTKPIVGTDSSNFVKASIV